MPTVQGFRATNPSSPFRYLYGERNGVLLFPLDITFTHFNQDTADASGAFIGALVNGAGFSIGTIASYLLPPVGAVNPVVGVTPDPAFPIAAATVLPPLPLPVQPAGTRVLANLGNGSTVAGTLLAFTVAAAYLDAAHTVSAYITQFDVPLRPDHHGAPVFLAADSATVIGMITSTQAVFNAPNSLVCPV